MAKNICLLQVSNRNHNFKESVQTGCFIAHRRQAALNEIQRLKVEGYIRPPGAPTERGSLYINAITLPLRTDYIRTLASGMWFSPFMTEFALSIFHVIMVFLFQLQF